MLGMARHSSPPSEPEITCLIVDAVISQGLDSNKSNHKMLVGAVMAVTQRAADGNRGS